MELSHPGYEPEQVLLFSANPKRSKFNSTITIEKPTDATTIQSSSEEQKGIDGGVTDQKGDSIQEWYTVPMSEVSSDPPLAS